MLAGSTIATATPHGLSSTRSESAIASSACFEAAYGPRNGSALLPPMEPMRTTRPRARRSAGRNACVTATWPTTFTSSWCLSSSSGTSSSGAAIAIPALSTRPSSVEPTASAAAAICSASVTSSRSASTPRSPSAEASSSVRTPPNTLQPPFASRMQQASPMPEDAPVTTTVFTRTIVARPTRSVGEPLLA